GGGGRCRNRAAWGMRSLLPTWRLLLLVLGALLPLALADVAPAAVWLTPLLLLGIVGGVALDVRQTAAPDRLLVSRVVAERLSLGAENPVVLVLTNRGPRPLAIRLRDE